MSWNPPMGSLTPNRQAAKGRGGDFRFVNSGDCRHGFGSGFPLAPLRLRVRTFPD
jgi:hypothetical protein